MAVKKGGRHSDLLVGTSQADSLYGEGGSDILLGGAGADLLFGGTGDDLLEGGAGNDRLDGGLGNDLLWGGAGLDTAVYAGSFFDYSLRDLFGAAVTVRDRTNGDIDLLAQVEKIEFADATIWLDGRNNGPMTVADLAGLNEDGSSVSGNVLSNDIDPDGDRLSVRNAGTFALNFGTLSLSADGRFNYVLDRTLVQGLAAGQTAVETFSYIATDGRGGQQRNTLSVTVQGSNDAPFVGAPLIAAANEDASSVPLLLTASDPDAGDAIDSFTLTSLPLAGAGTLYTDAALSIEAVAGVAYAASGGTLTLYFAPRENFNGEVQFNYTASDGELSSATATATITLSQQNDVATFGGDLSGSGEENGGAITGTLTVSDDADGMTAPNFRIETGDGPTNGAASIDSVTGQWSYTPNANFDGADHFTVSVTDDDGNVETRIIDIAVEQVSHPTVANDDAFTVTEDFGGSGNVLANDDSDNDVLPVVALSGVRDADSPPQIVITEIMANPVFVSEADGEWFEVYNAGAAPVDLNGWTIQVGGNTILVDSPRPLLVAPGGFFVFAANFLFVNSAGGGYEIGPLGLANNGTRIALFDPGGHEIDRVDYRPANVPADPPNTFPPDVEGLSFYLRDAVGDNNDGLLWESTPNGGFEYGASVNQGTPGFLNPIFGGAPGLGDPPVVGQPAVFLSGALLTLNADGTFVFDANNAYDFLAEGQSAIEQFTYTLSDGQTANVVLTIEGANDAPVAHDDAYIALEDAPLAANPPDFPSVLRNDSDIDSAAALTARLVTAPSHGSLTFNPDGTFVYTPDPEFSGTDSFTYVVNDGFVDSNLATVEIQVIALNDAPVAHDDEATTGAHTAISGNVLGNDTDVDGDALSVLTVAGLSPANVLPNIMISEIMDNPALVPDLTGEWFEVFNAGALPVDLNGWTLQIGTNTIVVDNNAPLLIPAGGYFTFVANGDPSLNGGIPVIGYETGPLGLVNSGIAITLFDAAGHEIDHVDTSAIELPPEGHSFFLLDASLDNGLGTSWETSDIGFPPYGLGGVGTPGQGALGAAGPIAEIGEQVMLDSGALLTLNADGTFDYDPNGAFDDLAAGDTATDGFSYMTSDGHGGIDTAVVTITIQGPDDPLNGASSFLL